MLLNFWGPVMRVPVTGLTYTPNRRGGEVAFGSIPAAHFLLTESESAWALLGLFLKGARNFGGMRIYFEGVNGGGEMLLYGRFLKGVG